MRTRIWSAISSGRARSSVTRVGRGRRVTAGAGPSGRRRAVAPAGGSPPTAAVRAAGRTVSTSSGEQDAVVVDEGLEDDAGRGRDDGRVQRLAGHRVAEVVRAAEHQGDAAVQLGELDDLGLLGVDREDDDLLLAVEGRRGAGVRAWARPRRCCRCPRAAAAAACPSTCMPWSRSLTLVLLRPETTVMDWSSRVHGHDRELVAGEADQHVHEVAGLDDRADAGHLVHLDRDADLARRHRRWCATLPPVAVEDGARDELVLRDGLAGDLADDLRRVGVAVRGLVGLLEDLGRHRVRRELRAERDVLRRDDDVDLP